LRGSGQRRQRGRRPPLATAGRCRSKQSRVGSGPWCRLSRRRPLQPGRSPGCLPHRVEHIGSTSVPGLGHVSLSLIGCATTTKGLAALASSSVEHRYDLLRRLARPSVTAARYRPRIGRHALAAKPIIEIVVVSPADAPEAIARLVSIGYEHQGSLGVEGRGLTDDPPHHLYLSPTASEELRAQLTFRDRLRAEADLAARYEILKRSLAVRFRDDRMGYTDAKTKFVVGASRPNRSSS